MGQRDKREDRPGRKSECGAMGPQEAREGGLEFLGGSHKGVPLLWGSGVSGEQIQECAIGVEFCRRWKENLRPQ